MILNSYLSFIQEDFKSREKHRAYLLKKAEEKLVKLIKQYNQCKKSKYSDMFDCDKRYRKRINDAESEYKGYRSIGKVVGSADKFIHKLFKRNRDT